MPTVGDLRTELDESVRLNRLVNSDLNIISNIVFPIKTTLDLYVLYQAKSNLLFDYLTTTEKALLVASKLPVIGGALGAIRFVGKRFNETLRDVSDTLSVIDKPLDLADKAMTGVSLSLLTASATSFSALAVNGKRVEALNSLVTSGALADDVALTGTAEDNYWQLVQANAITRDVTDATKPLRDNLGALDLSIFGLLSGGLETANDTIDKILDVFEPFSEALDELNDAIEPVEWALDAADAIVSKVVDPVIEAVLEATGLSELIDDLSERIFGQIAFLDALNSYAERVRVELDDYDVAALVNGYWDEFSVLFDPGGGIDLLNNIGVIEIEKDGSVRVIGTDGGDTLVGTGNDDIFYPLQGDDTVDGLAGTDKATYLEKIEDYRVEFVTGSDGIERIRVAPRAEETSKEGIDLLTDIALLRFANPLIGDITHDDIRRFLYTAPGQPNLTGDGGDNWLFGDAANNILNGASGNDTIFGGKGDDILSGGPGGDLVFAGAGNDDVFVDVAADDAQVDTVHGGSGLDDLIVEGDLPLIVDFETGAVDFGPPGIMPFFDFETFLSGAGDDLFLGSRAVETIYGGGGDDTFLYAGAGDTFYSTNAGSFLEGLATVSFAGGGYAGVRVEAIKAFGPAYDRETIHAALDPDPSVQSASLSASLFGVEVIEGTAAADLFYALGVTQGQVFGLPAFTYVNEGQTYTLDGSVFLGGGGTDVFFASELGSFFDGGEGFDLVNFNLDHIIASPLSQSGIQRLSIDLAAGLATGLTQGSDVSDIHLRNIEGVVGSRVSDLIVGNDAPNYLFGYLGNDTIFGGGGADYIDASGLVFAELHGGDGNDIFALGPAEDAIVDGGAGSDVLELVPNQAFRLDVFFDEQALGDEGANLDNVSGWQVDLTIGEATSEFLETGKDPNNTVPFVYTASLTSIENVLGSEMNDSLAGNAEANLLLGRGGDDVLRGLGGDDNLNGGAGADTLFGGDGNDYLTGGTDGAGTALAGVAADRLHGGSGDDIFALVRDGGTGDGADRILDFVKGRDRIDLAALGVASFGAVGLQDGTVDGLAASAVIVDDAVVGWLIGVDAGSLDAADFLLVPPPPGASVAVDDAVTVGEDDGATGFGSVLKNDTNADRIASVELVSGPAAGILQFNPGPPGSPDGSFSFDPDGAFEWLGEGDTTTVAFVYKITDLDGNVSEANVAITVTGAEDGPVITGATQGAVAEDGALIAQGTLTATDPDAADTPVFVAQSATPGTYGRFSIDAAGDWMFQLDNAAAQALAGDETADMEFAVTARTADGETATEIVKITVTGAEDAPVIFGMTEGAVAEDGPHIAAGTLLAQDPDASDNPVFVAAKMQGLFGVFSIDAGGAWTYLFDEDLAEDLPGDEAVTDTFTVQAVTGDGEAASQTVTIFVTEDGAGTGGDRDVGGGTVPDADSADADGLEETGDPDNGRSADDRTGGREDGRGSDPPGEEIDEAALRGLPQTLPPAGERQRDGGIAEAGCDASGLARLAGLLGVDALDFTAGCGPDGEGAAAAALIGALWCGEGPQELFALPIPECGALEPAVPEGPPPAGDWDVL